jgi:hypothetical protein
MSNVLFNQPADDLQFASYSYADNQQQPQPYSQPAPTQASYNYMSGSQPQLYGSQNTMQSIEPTISWVAAFSSSHYDNEPSLLEGSDILEIDK